MGNTDKATDLTVRVAVDPFVARPRLAGTVAPFDGRTLSSDGTVILGALAHSSDVLDVRCGSPST